MLLLLLSMGPGIFDGNGEPPKIHRLDREYVVAYFQEDCVVLVDDATWNCYPESPEFYPSKAEKKECIRSIKAGTRFFMQNGATPLELIKATSNDSPPTSTRYKDYNRRDLRLKMGADYLKKSGFRVLNIYYFKKGDGFIDVGIYFGDMIDCFNHYNLRIFINEKPFRIVKYNP